MEGPRGKLLGLCLRACNPRHRPEGALCPSFELDVAEEAVEYYELPGLPQVIFYAMLLNEIEGLDGRFGLWSRPSLSSIGAHSSCGSGCMVARSSRFNSAQRSE